jgi:hypothetical protein
MFKNHFRELCQDIQQENLLTNTFIVEIKKQLPNNTFRQYEYLNDLYSKNAEIIGVEARQALFNSPSVLFLLSRGKEATKKWSLANPFDEKQDDTADILVVKDNFYEVIDIKTRNLSKTAQAPKR